jgi:hypothetical protein
MWMVEFIWVVLALLLRCRKRNLMIGTRFVRFFALFVSIPINSAIEVLTNHKRLFMINFIHMYLKRRKVRSSGKEGYTYAAEI